MQSRPALPFGSPNAARASAAYRAAAVNPGLLSWVHLFSSAPIARRTRRPTPTSWMLCRVCSSDRQQKRVGCQYVQDRRGIDPEASVQGNERRGPPVKLIRLSYRPGVAESKVLVAAHR